MKDKVFLLSLNGGGTKGILQTTLLHHICSRVSKQPREIFDVFVGTSVGSILSCLYTSNKNYTTKDAIDFFIGEPAKRIFKKRVFKTPIDYIKYKYAAKDIEVVLKERLGEETLGSLSKPVISTSYDTQNRQVVFINSSEDKYKDIKVWECARASSAAPTFFPPFKLGNLSLIDGGVAANNPTCFGFIEAKKMFPDKEIVVVNIGTGSCTSPISFEKLKDWTLLHWATSLFDIVNDGQSDTTEYAMQRLLNKDNIFSFNLKLPKHLDTLDSLDNIPELIGITYDYINGEWAEEIARLISIISQLD